VAAAARRAVSLAALLRDRLAEISGVRVLDRGPELAAIVTCTIAGWQPQPLKQAVAARGINATISLLEYARYDFGAKGLDFCLRLSPHYYNTEDELDRVAGAVRELAGAGSAGGGQHGLRPAHQA